MRWTMWPLLAAAVMACSKGKGEGDVAAGGEGAPQYEGPEPTVRAVDTTVLTDPQGVGTDRSRPVPMPPAAGTLQPTPGFGYGTTAPGATPRTVTVPTYPESAPMRSPDAPATPSYPTPPDRERPLEPLRPTPVPRPDTTSPAPTPPAPAPAPSQPAPQPPPVPPEREEPAPSKPTPSEPVPTPTPPPPAPPR